MFAFNFYSKTLKFTRAIDYIERCRFEEKCTHTAKRNHFIIKKTNNKLPKGSLASRT